MAQNKQSSVNLGRKTTAPAGGFTEGTGPDSDSKKQKVDGGADAKVVAKQEEESSDMFECENCGS